jgi:uncharacterized phiE125 gp8 family phage protein
MAFSMATPTTEPVSLALAKEQLREDSDAADTLITGLITAAREYWEDFCGRAFITRECTLTVPFARSVALRMPPVQEVTSVIVTDSAGVETTLDDETDYRLVTTGIVPVVELLTTPADAETVTVSYTAGYGDTAADVPTRAIQAILITITHWYDHRGLLADVPGQTEAPLAARSLMVQLRVSW